MGYDGRGWRDVEGRIRIGGSNNVGTGKVGDGSRIELAVAIFVLDVVLDVAVEVGVASAEAIAVATGSVDEEVALYVAVALPL